MTDIDTLIAELRAAVGNHQLGSFRVDVADVRALLDHIERLEGRAISADEALRTISVVLGGSDEWSDQRQMILDVHRQVEEVQAELARLRAPVTEGEVGEVVRRLQLVAEDARATWSPLAKVTRQDATTAADLIQRLAGQVAEARGEIERWRGLRDAIAELRGYGPEWPEHGNVPLAIAAGYSLTLNHATTAEARLREAVEVLKPFAKAGAIKLCGEWKDHERFCQTDVGFYLHFGDLRRATAFLATLEDHSNG